MRALLHLVAVVLVAGAVGVATTRDVEAGSIGGGSISTPGGGGGGSASASTWATVFKTADETRANNDTPTADSALTFATTDGVTYHVRGILFFDSDDAAGFYVEVATAYNNRSRMAFSDVTGNGPGTINSTNGSGLATIDVGNVALDYIAVGDGSPHTILWSQNTADPENITVFAGSYLEYAAVQ
jgi:hypothetical protein